MVDLVRCHVSGCEETQSMFIKLFASHPDFRSRKQSVCCCFAGFRAVQIYEWKREVGETTGHFTGDAVSHVLRFKKPRARNIGNK